MKYKYIKFSKQRKLRILINNVNKGIFVVFLHGFKSDIEGKKPISLFRFCKKKKINFLAIEYSGHGKSSGKFINGNISKWKKDIESSIIKLVKKRQIIFVGSSMGSWLSLLQFKKFNSQIKGFIGIGSAPDFLDQLMWNKFTKEIKREIIFKKYYLLKNNEYEYPISYQLIKDGRKNKILNKKIFLKIDVKMIHGKNDTVVPVSFSRKVLKIFKKANKKLILVNKGDHSLSSKKDLKLIISELNKMLINVI